MSNLPKISSISPNVVIGGLVAAGFMYLLYKWTIADDDVKPDGTNNGQSIFEKYPNWVKKKTDLVVDQLVGSPLWWLKKAKDLLN
jgi:hypothetical protein